jgi:hypothetical protein
LQAVYFNSSDLTDSLFCSMFAVDDGCVSGGNTCLIDDSHSRFRPERGSFHMQVLGPYVAALAIAGLYYYWRDKVVNPIRRRRILRERVTYMLWCAANTVA